MEDSILTSTKKLLGLETEDTSFDLDIATHINSTLIRLRQLGIGPVEGFIIQNATETWDSFFTQDTLQDATLLNSVKSFMHVSVKLLFDPPPTSYHIQALEAQRDELGTTIMYQREAAKVEKDGLVPPDDLELPADLVLFYQNGKV